MITLPGGKKVHADSTGKEIKIGNRIRFRGTIYTLKAFGPVEEQYGVATLIFEEPLALNVNEVPHECNVDYFDG